MDWTDTDCCNLAGAGQNSYPQAQLQADALAHMQHAILGFMPAQASPHAPLPVRSSQQPKLAQQYPGQQLQRGPHPPR